MKRQDHELLRLIAVFKLVKALTLIAVGAGALHLQCQIEKDSAVADPHVKVAKNTLFADDT